MKRIIAFILTLYLLTFMLCGCEMAAAPGDAMPSENQKPGDALTGTPEAPLSPIPEKLEVGFYVMGMPEDTSFAAYRSDKNGFALNDVRLSFAFGEYFDDKSIAELLETRSYPSVSIYFADEDGNWFLAEQLNSEYISNKFNCYIDYDEKYDISYLNFNYYITLVIPSEVFSKESGIIYFRVEGVNVKGDTDTPDVLNSRGIFYKVEDGRVYLSNQFFE